jgi:cysteine desulfurase
MDVIYLDNNATTKPDPQVVQAMLPYLTEWYGNPSSVHRFGQRSRQAVDEARGQIAALVNCAESELLFTGGGTEAVNTAVRGILASRAPRRRIVTTAVEHSATRELCSRLAEEGVEVVTLDVDAGGEIDLYQLATAVTDDTALVTLMWANNETGVIFPIEEIAAIVKSKGALFHTDAVQAAGKVPLNVAEVPIDFLSVSAHKLHAPKGIGCLYARRRTKFQPYVIGGGQERGRRGGTENVANMVAFGRAAELALANLNEENTRVRVLRDKLENGILGSIRGSIRNGCKEPRLPNTSNLAFEGVEAEGILLLLDQAGICASSGSACTTGSLDPSHVLMAMGCPIERARGSIRLSLGIYNTEQEVDFVLKQFPRIISRLRGEDGKSRTINYPNPAPRKIPV